MDYKVELTAEAIANIRDIHDFIGAEQSGKPILGIAAYAI